MYDLHEMLDLPSGALFESQVALHSLQTTVASRDEAAATSEEDETCDPLTISMALPSENMSLDMMVSVGPILYCSACPLQDHSICSCRPMMTASVLVLLARRSTMWGHTRV